MSGKAKSSPTLSEEAQIVIEAVNVITEASEILAKSMEVGKKKKKTKEPLAKKDPSFVKPESNDKDDDEEEEEDKEDEGKEEEKGKEEGEPKEGEPSELSKAGDDLVGEIPESTAKSEGESSAVSFDLAGLSMEQLLELSTKALKEVSARGVSSRSKDDVQAAEHEINEIKQDAARGGENSDPMAKSPVAETVQNPSQSPVEPQPQDPVSNEADPSADSSMEAVFAERELPALISMYEKLGEHISARSEIQKNTQPKPAAPSAIAMMKSFQEGLSKSVKETIASEIKALFSEESKKVSSEIEAMKKSLNQVKKDLDSVPASGYTSSVSNAKDNEKLLAKSLHETPEQTPSINKDELARKIISLQKSNPNSKVDFTRLVYRTTLAKSYNELKQVQDELDGLNFKN
jgi:hypothetical protein